MSSLINRAILRQFLPLKLPKDVCNHVIPLVGQGRRDIYSSGIQAELHTNT